MHRLAGLVAPLDFGVGFWLGIQGFARESRIDAYSVPGIL
jgi:hypothetical protein